MECVSPRVGVVSFRDVLSTEQAAILLPARESLQVLYELPLKRISLPVLFILSTAL